MRLAELLLHSPATGGSQRFLDTSLSFVSEPPNSDFAQVRYLASPDLAQGVDNYWKFSVFTDSAGLTGYRRVIDALHWQ